MSLGWEAAADVVVVGSGVAGMTAALAATRQGLSVLVVTKGAAGDGSTALAQGGIAVVLPHERDPGDSPERHVADTLAAGAGLCDERAVRLIIGDGPSAVGRLRTLGARFDTTADGLLARTREGGHTAFRVVHSGGDATGAEVERTLLAAARDRSVVVLERHIASRVVQSADGAVAGLAVLDGTGVPGLVRTRAVILATGGFGQLYRATTNPPVATGDGLALALRAGAEVADVEFVQFHPTVLYTGPRAAGRRPLVTEAVRGEGAVLLDGAGRPVMAGVHPLGDLAPRDVVAAAITRRLAEAPGGIDDHVFLDATGLTETSFPDRFPTVYAACREAGIDPSVDPIPVAPAAHFVCGGVVATVAGRTNVAGLYAVGEVARTGLHGANRLASNSLLEGLVMGERAARAVAYDLARRPDRRAPLLDHPADDAKAPAVDRHRLTAAMSRHAGIGRSAEGLADVAELLGTAVPVSLRNRDAVEAAALTLVARAVVTAAAAREETRGCHVRHDYPGRDDAHWQHSLVLRATDDDEPIPVSAPLRTQLTGAA